MAYNPPVGGIGAGALGIGTAATLTWGNVG
jgi:hypothetical protein